MKFIFSLKISQSLFIFIIIFYFFNLVSPIKLSSSVNQPFQWKFVMIKDSEESLPYQTYVDGKHYEESGDFRFKQMEEKHPPLPDMPEKEPAVLLEMEEKFTNLLGFPHPMGHSEPSNMTVEQLENNIFNQKLIEKDFRFAQINSDSHLSESDKETLLSRSKDQGPSGDGYDTVNFASAWASSVWTFRWYHYYHSYPASNAIYGYSYWASTYGIAKDQVVTWQGDFERVRRISHLWIRWATAPGMLSIQTTSDGKTWEERIPWRQSAKSPSNNFLTQLYNAFSQSDRSFAESVVFEEPIWASGVRILMKDPVFSWFGIYQVKAWTKQWVVQLKSGQSAESDECLNLDNGVYTNGAEITVRNCIEAIKQGDARELFVLQNNLEVTSYHQDLCIETSNGVLDESSRIQLWNCAASRHPNDRREKWLLDPKGYMKIMKNSQKCLTIKGSEVEIQQMGGSVVSASSTMDDGQHLAKLAVDGGDDSFWASSPGVEKTEFKIMFPSQTIKEIVIQWKYIPSAFEVQCFINGYWRSFASVKENDESENKFDIGSKTISGVKIQMIQASEQARFNEKVIYGIKELRIKTGSKKVHLKDCDSDGDTQLNKWFVDDSNFVDTTTAPILAYEFQRLFDNTNKLLDLINTLITWPPTIEQMISKAKLISTQTVKIESDVNDIDIKIEHFKSNSLVDDEEKKDCNVQSSVGSNSLKPAASCAYIKQLFPYKMTGYYWIQPECATVPIRVFCDYSTFSSGMDYAYYGGLGDSVVQSKIKNINDVGFYCSKLGLYPVELTSKAQILMIHKYLEDIGVIFESKGFVPMGIDYACSKHTCSGKYNSLNSRTSKDITEFMKGMIDTKNILMQVFSKAFYKKQNDLIGFGLSKTGAMTSKFESNIPIKGIVCSTNKDKIDSEANWVKADCDTKARGNTDFDGVISTNIKVVCPAGCLNTGTGKIYGTEIFTDDSSICKAAIHNGVINSDKGGNIEVGMLEGRSSYLGSESNGIKSESQEKWDRSFVTNKFVVSCPIDNFKRYAKSFLEIDESSEQISGMLGKTKNSLSSAKNLASNAIGKAQSVAGNKINQASNAASQAANAAGQAVNKASSLANQASNSINQAASTVANNLLGSNSDAASAGKLVDTKTGNGGGQLDSTEEAVEKLIALFDIDKNDISKQVRLVKDTAELINKLQSQYGPLLNSNLSPDAQYAYLISLEMHLKGTDNEMNKVLAKAATKLKKKQDYLAKLKIDKIKYQRYEPYIEKYELPLADIYEIHDFGQATGGPSTWSFSKSGLNGHSDAIGQTSDIQINGDRKEHFASLLKLKMKNYYDGKFCVSFLAKDTGRVGFAFRYLDEFNFYAFEMETGSAGKSGYKRIRKFVNGEPTVLAIENDGGFLQDKWYRIIIDFSFSKFTVKMEEETEKNLNPDFEDGITKVIEGFDGDFAEGGFAFLVNSMAGVYFDKFSVKPNKCIDQMKNDETKSFLPPTCSRFKESFFTDMNFLWKPVDPENNKNGPSVWNYKTEVMGRNRAIVQSSFIYGSDAPKIPAILELKIEKVCNEGLIQAEFFTSDKTGYVGIGFHYHNSKNHYVFEMYGQDKDRYCQVRKVIDGDYKLLQKTEDNKCGYFVDKWNFITIKMTSKEWIFYMAKENEGLAEALKMDVDQEFQHGSFALMVFENKASFTGIKTMPLDDFLFKGLPSVDVVSVEVQQPVELQKEKIPENTKEKKNSEKAAEYESCLENKTPEERDKFCANKFPQDNAAQNDCKSNYCDRCCEDNIDESNKQKRFKCKRTCKGLSQTSKESDEWHFCVSSPRPNLSIYQFCEVNQKTVFEKHRCKLDFCNLCCTISNGAFKKNFADNSIVQCHNECMDNFPDTTNDFVASPQ